MRFVQTAVAPVVALALVGATAAVAQASSTGSVRSGASSSTTIVIGNEGFGESYILQDIYGDLLQSAGYTVKLLAQASSSRAEAIPALESGSVDVVPDYAGSLLVYLAKNDQKQAGNITTALPALNAILGKKGVAVLPGTAGLDQNVFVVTAATAAKYHLSTIASLKSHASGWTFGAPPECSTYYFCAPGLKSVYGISFKSVKSYDESGPLTVKALQSGTAQVAELFSTDSVITADKFVVLADNLNLEPADHLVPVLRKSIDTGGVAAALAVANKALTTAELTTLDAQLSGGSHPTPATVAHNFLKSKGLIH